MTAPFLQAEQYRVLEDCPQVFLHVDGDSFFAACEQVANPTLRGKPVVTGLERGIVSAASIEAKARGVKRGVSLWDARKICPDAVFLPSDYELYSMVSMRMYAILRRFTPHVEEYSIDEAFADITDFHHAYGSDYTRLGAAIKNALERELGMTFSVGIAQTKVLTKVGSKWKKPSGLTVIHPANIREFLAEKQIEDLWGIGQRIGARMRIRGIGTALSFYQKPEGWIKQYLFKPQQEMWYELHGFPVYNINEAPKDSYDMISKTRTFTPPSTDRDYIFAQLSKNIENACIKARRYGLATHRIGIFLKKQNFSSRWKEGVMTERTAYPIDMIQCAEKLFMELYEPGVEYRATGVVLLDLNIDRPHQLSLFENVETTDQHQALYESVDTLAAHFGKHTIFLGSSLRAVTMLDERMEHRRRGATLAAGGSMLRESTAPQKKAARFTRRFVGIPVMGSVK